MRRNTITAVPGCHPKSDHVSFTLRVQQPDPCVRYPLLAADQQRRGRSRHWQRPGGNRTRHGPDTQQVLASVVGTAHQRQLELTALLATVLRATYPVVPTGLQIAVAVAKHLRPRTDRRTKLLGPSRYVPISPS